MVLSVVCLQETYWPRLRKAIQQQGQRVSCQKQKFPKPEPRLILTMAKRGKRGPREAAAFSDENRPLKTREADGSSHQGGQFRV
jgi:hypothetical protein